MSARNGPINPDVAAGLLFVAFGLYFCGGSLIGLSFGTAFRMGPGFFPAVVGGMLLVLGIVIAVLGLRKSDADWGRVPWRGVVLIPLGLLLFGAMMRPLGLLIALLTLCFLAAQATGKIALWKAAALSVSMTALCIGIFSYGLGISMPILGDWLR